jgi:MFS family permease
VLAVWHLRRNPHPLIDLSSLRIPTFAVTIWGGSLFRIAIGATPFLLPLMFQTGFGMNAFTSGLLVLAVFAGNLLMKPATTPVLRRFGFRTVLIANGLLAAVTIFACALFTSSTPKAIIVAVLFAGGLFRSMQFTSLNTVGFADIHKSQLSAASTLSSMIQQMTIGMGIAVGAIALRLAGALHSTNPDSLTAGDFRIAFALVGVIALVAVIDSFSLASNAGADVSGHRSTHGPLRADDGAFPGRYPAGLMLRLLKSVLDPLLVNNNHRVWMIVGTSKGFGGELARAALQRAIRLSPPHGMIQRRLSVQFRPADFRGRPASMGSQDNAG